MFKIRVLFLLLIPLLFSRCEEEAIDLRNTAPTIKFAFRKDGKTVRLDSVRFVGTDSVRIFQDTLFNYILPLNHRDEESIFRFYAQSVESEVVINYRLSLLDDIDKIKYDAFLKSISYFNVDSLAVECRDTLICKTNDATVFLYY